MSTRCQIGLYEPNEKDLNKWEALIYRHSDGYPGTVNESGVLADIIPFLHWWNSGRGIGDYEYCSARLLQYLCNKYDLMAETPEFTGTLGHGICKGFHSDIAYFYAIYPDRLRVFETRNDDCNTWKLIKTVKLTKRVAGTRDTTTEW